MSRSLAWTAWPSPTTATCTRRGSSTSRPRRRRSGRFSGSKHTSRLDRGAAREKPSWAPAAYSHLVLLARNRTGYKNLVRLTSIGFTEGFYRRPRIDKEVLAAHSEGVLCLAACLSGEVALHLRQGRYEEARSSAEWFSKTFGRDGFWLEIQQHGIPEERGVTEGMLRLGEELGIPVVATNDAHYLRREDAEAHDVLLAIGTGSDLDDPKRFRFTGQESYVKSEAEMQALFPDHPETLANTARVAELCEFDFEKRYFLPEFPLPAEYRTDEELLNHLARTGAERRYGLPSRPEVRDPAGVRARGHQPSRLCRIFPDRSGFHCRGSGPGHSGGAGPRVGCRIVGGLRARHHRRLPPQIRSALRALSQSRACFDAGYRRRFLLRAPGRGDRVRAGALWTDERGPDRHLRYDEGPCRSQGRGAGAPYSAWRSGPDNEAHPFGSGIQSPHSGGGCEGR